MHAKVPPAPKRTRSIFSAPSDPTKTALGDDPERNPGPAPNPLLWELLAYIEDTLAAKANRTHREKTPTDWADYSIVPLEFNRWQNKEGPYDVRGRMLRHGRPK